MGRFLCVNFAGSQDITNPSESFRCDEKTSRDQGLARRHIPISTNLLVLRVVDIDDMALGLHAFADREVDDGLAVRNQLVCGLLQGRNALIDPGQRIVANSIGLLDVGRDILVRLVEVGQDRFGEGLVSGVAQLYGLLAVRVFLEVSDAIIDDRVATEVLGRSYVSSTTCFARCLTRKIRKLTDRVADEGGTSPFTWGDMVNERGGTFDVNDAVRHF